MKSCFLIYVQLISLNTECSVELEYFVQFTAQLINLKYGTIVNSALEKH